MITVGAHAAVVGRAVGSARRAAGAVTGSRAARVAARIGYVARTGFYVVLTGIVVAIALQHGGGRQANAHGALSLLTRSTVGLVAVVAAAAGFVVLGVVRVSGAVRDRDASGWRRAATGLQGLFYAAVAWVPLSFALGHHAAGSEGAEHREAATVLAWPAGREIVAAVGVVVVTVCGFQIRSALNRDFADGLDLSRCPRWLRPAVTAAGVVGIIARALVFLPLGVLFVVAAVQFDPGHADGLDSEVAALARQPWGPVLLAVVALGLAVFATYSAFEAALRDVGKGQ